MIDLGKAFVSPNRYRPDEPARRQNRPLDDEPSPPSGGGDRGRIDRLLGALITEIENRPLSAIVPRGAGPGADRRLGRERRALRELPGQPGDRRRRDREPGSRRGAQWRRHPAAAGPLRRPPGRQPAHRIAPGTPLGVRRFDDFAAAFSEAMTVEGAVADGLQDGFPPGATELVGAMIQAIRNSLLMGDLQGARRAGTDAAAMIVAIWQVLNGDSEPAQRRQRGGRPAMRPVPNSPHRAHYALPGYEGTERELRRKHARVVGYRTEDGEFVAPDEAEIRDGRARRHRGGAR